MAWKQFYSLLGKGWHVGTKWKQALTRLTNLTSGDFANVPRQQTLSGENPTPQHLFALLERELLMKEDGGLIGMGFLANI